MPRFSQLYPCRTSSHSQTPLYPHLTANTSFFLTSAIPQSVSFSTSPPAPFNMSYIFISFLKNNFACAFSFFSPNNFLLLAPASHSECCVKICASFLPTIWILLTQPCTELSFPWSTKFPLLGFSITYCFYAQIIPACQHISPFQISPHFSHATFLLQFCSLNTHLSAHCTTVAAYLLEKYFIY